VEWGGGNVSCDNYTPAYTDYASSLAPYIDIRYNFPDYGGKSCRPQNEGGTTKCDRGWSAARRLCKCVSINRNKFDLNKYKYKTLLRCHPQMESISLSL